MAVMEKVFIIHSRELLTYRVREANDLAASDLSEAILIEVKDAEQKDGAYSNMRMEIAPDALPLIIEALSSFMKK